MNRTYLSLRVALFLPIVLSTVGCGAVRGVACRICHRPNKCDCDAAPPCAMNVSYSPDNVIIPQGTFIQAMPVAPPPGMIFQAPPPGAVPITPPAQSMKPVPDDVDSELMPMPTSPSPSLTPPPPAPAQTKSAKPGGLTLQVGGSKGIAAVGEELVYEIRLENQGESPIDEVKMTARFSDNLRPKSVSPEGSGDIVGNRVDFKAIRPLTPMAITYQVTAEVLMDGDTGKVDVEVTSPILGANPLREEIITRVTNP